LLLHRTVQVLGWRFYGSSCTCTITDGSAYQGFQQTDMRRAWVRWCTRQSSLPCLLV